MSDTQDTDIRAQLGELMPVLAQLDETASQLETAAAEGEEITTDHINTYELQARHGHQLLQGHDLTPGEVHDAESEHRGDGATGYAARGLDHILHTRHFEPAPPATIDNTEEEIEL